LVNRYNLCISGAPVAGVPKAGKTLLLPLHQHLHLFLLFEALVGHKPSDAVQRNASLHCKLELFLGILKLQMHTVIQNRHRFPSGPLKLWDILGQACVPCCFASHSGL